MLVLKINAPEKLHIGDDISLQFSPDPCNEIMRVKRVKVAVEAPDGVTVLRSELIQEKERNL